MEGSRVPGGSLRHLLTATWNIASAAWSPDGKSVVYSPGNGDVDVIGSDGTGTRKLVALGGSANRTQLVARRQQNSAFLGQSALGDVVRRIGTSPVAAWLAPLVLAVLRTLDSRWEILRISESRGGLFGGYSHPPGSQLWVLDERRGLLRRSANEPVQLTSGPIRWNTPIPSKDGTKIFAHGVIERGELVRL